MYIIYLKEEDLLKPEQFPAVALINEAANSDLFEFVENLNRGIGSGYDYSNCSFWNEMDEYDQLFTPRFDGLLLNNESGEEIIVPYKDFLYYLEILYSRLMHTNFSRLSDLRNLLDNCKTKYC